MNRDIKVIAKEIDWFEFFNKINIYNIKIDLNVKMWDDFVLKNFPKINFFDPSTFGVLVLGKPLSACFSVATRNILT